MKNWPWQKIVGKLILLVVAIVELVLESLEITSVGWFPTVATFATWVAQFIIGLIPAPE